MNKIANRVVICDVLMESAKTDKDIVVMCSDSRGSASLKPFSEKFPEQFVETGIAEQDLVGIAAGMAKSGKKVFAVSPASFLSTRSYEQVKIDCSYTNANVKLIGISGGISYGALGMSHHSLQDIAALSALPNMRVYLPSDRFETKSLVRELLKDVLPAYIRVGRNAVEDIYDENISFELNKAVIAKEGKDVAIIACGEMVKNAVDAAKLLEKEGISAKVVDMYCLKPLDTQTISELADTYNMIFTVEEHSPFGGLGSLCAQIISQYKNTQLFEMSLPDFPVISGTSKEVFQYYGLDAHGIAEFVKGHYHG